MGFSDEQEDALARAFEAYRRADALAAESRELRREACAELDAVELDRSVFKAAFKISKQDRRQQALFLEQRDQIADTFERLGLSHDSGQQPEKVAEVAHEPAPAASATPEPAPAVKGKAKAPSRKIDIQAGDDPRKLPPPIRDDEDEAAENDGGTRKRRPDNAMILRRREERQANIARVRSAIEELRARGERKITRQAVAAQAGVAVSTAHKIIKAENLM